jgi:hypothetical protein
MIDVAWRVFLWSVLFQLNAETLRLKAVVIQMLAMSCDHSPGQVEEGEVCYGRMGVRGGGKDAVMQGDWVYGGRDRREHGREQEEPEEN